MQTYIIASEVNTLISVLSVVLLPLKLAAYFIHLAQTLIRAVFGGIILGCLAPLGLMAIMVVALLLTFVL